MTAKPTRYFWIILLALLTACGTVPAPTTFSPTFDPSSLNTIIAQTAGAAATQTFVLQPTLTHAPTDTKTPTEIPTSTPTFIFVLFTPNAFVRFTPNAEADVDLPRARIAEYPTGKIGQPIQFDASASYVPSGLPIILYEWDFDGDGVFDLQTTEATATHVYDAAYKGDVILRVTSLKGTAIASTRALANLEGYAPQGGEKPCPLDENGISILTDERGIFLNCTPDHLPQSDREGVTAVILPPTVISSVRARANPTNLAGVDFTVTFSVTVRGVDVSDFALTTTGVTGASVVRVSGSDDTYTVTVNTGRGNGTIRLDVLDDDTIMDLGSNPLDGGFTSGESYTIKKIAP